MDRKQVEVVLRVSLQDFFGQSSIVPSYLLDDLARFLSAELFDAINMRGPDPSLVIIDEILDSQEEAVFCDGGFPHVGPWEHIPKSDQASRCFCGYVSGK